VFLLSWEMRWKNIVQTSNLPYSKTNEQFLYKSNTSFEKAR
jgi:hypothetical protein